MNDEYDNFIKDLQQGLKSMSEGIQEAYRLMSQGRFDEAEKIMRHVTRNYPDAIESRLMFADLLVERGKCEEALPVIEEAIKAMPHQGIPWELRGRALTKLNRMDEARKSMRRALEVEPRNPLLKELVEYWFRTQNMR